MGAQAVIGPQWEAEARKIYDNYTIYHQGGGAEQSVFDVATGAASSRSSRLLHRLEGAILLAEHGRLLDIGCGNGTTSGPRRDSPRLVAGRTRSE